MKLFFLNSLRIRLLLLVLVAIIPAWGVIAYTAAEQRRIAVSEIQRNVLRLAEFSAHEEEQGHGLHRPRRPAGAGQGDGER